MMLLLTIIGCNKIKDAATINVPAQLNASIPVVVTAVSGDFSGTADLNLASFEEITPYIEKIKAISKFFGGQPLMGEQVQNANQVVPKLAAPKKVASAPAASGAKPKKEGC